MSRFTRTINVKTDKNTITDPITLMLTFDKIPTTGPPMDQLAWRVINYGGGNQNASVTYVADLMFSSVQIDAGKLVTAGAFKALDLGQQTSLIRSGGGVDFTTPAPGITGEMTATNMSQSVRAIGVGFVNSKGDPEPVLVWQSVGNTNSVQAKFTPVLNAYITSNYQETQVIQGQIVSPVLLKANIALFPEVKSFLLIKNPDGSYALIPN